MADSQTRLSGFRLRHGELRAILIIGDLLVSYISLFIGMYFWAAGDLWYKFSFEFIRVRVPFWFYLLPFAWLILMVELYDIPRASNLRKTLSSISIAALSGVLLYALIYMISRKGSLPRTGVGAFLLANSVLALFWRIGFIRLFTASRLMRRVLIIGAGKAGQTLVRAYQSLTPTPFDLIGYIDDDPEKIGTLIEGYPVLASSDQLLEVLENEHISDLVIAITGEMRGSTFQSILDAQEMGVDVTRMPKMYEEIINRVPIHHLESDWIVRSFVDEARTSGFYELGKRIIDLISGLIGLLFFIGTLPIVALAIILDDGLPIFYSQDRLGKGGRPFRIFKYRTMFKDAEKDGQPQTATEHDPRITRLGSLLRRSRIDEIPQIINILSGEMSMVGPRAEREEWVRHFQKEIPFYRARLLVKPGLTGWAQVNYGYTATVEDTGIKLEYDLYYIKHRSLLLDLVIILRTVGTVLRLRGR